MDAKWNPHTRELTVIYDAKVTSARHIKHFKDIFYEKRKSIQKNFVPLHCDSEKSHP